MTPGNTLVELIDQLPPDERQHVDEYIHYLYEQTHSQEGSTDTFDPRYIEYLRAGIREGEEAAKNGDMLSVAEGRKYLDDLLAK